MSRPNLARLEPSAYTVLSVADPAKVATTTEQVLGELDLDHLCRLLIRSERSLSLVNRRSFAAALADVPATPNAALRPAPPFADAVAVAREDGKLLERTRLYLAQNPRALEELTPELTLALLRHFDPSMRMRPSPFTRHVIAVGGVTIIALVAAVLGIVHTEKNDEITATVASQQYVQKQRVAQKPSITQPAAVVLAAPQHFDNNVAVIPRTSIKSVAPAAPAEVAASETAPAAASVTRTVAHTTSSAPAAKAGNGTALFVPAVTAKAATTTQTTPAASASATTLATTKASETASVGSPAQATTADGVAIPAAPSGANTDAVKAAQATPATPAAVPERAAATAMVLRSIVAQNPSSHVQWIRAHKASDNVVTVTSRVSGAKGDTRETYHLWNSGGKLTVISHESSTL